jgi:hypothetical protein
MTACSVGKDGMAKWRIESGGFAAGTCVACRDFESQAGEPDRLARSLPWRDVPFIYRGRTLPRFSSSSALWTALSRRPVAKSASMRRSSGLGPAYSSSHRRSSSSSSCVRVPIARWSSSTFFPFMSCTRSQFQAAKHDYSTFTAGLRANWLVGLRAGAETLGTYWRAGRIIWQGVDHVLRWMR